METKYSYIVEWAQNRLHVLPEFQERMITGQKRWEEISSEEEEGTWADL